MLGLGCSIAGKLANADQLTNYGMIALTKYQARAKNVVLHTLDCRHESLMSNIILVAVSKNHLGIWQQWAMNRLYY